MSISPESVALLTDIGFAAASNGLAREALVIFEGVGAVRPQSEAPGVGIAMTHLGRGAYREAVEALRDSALPKSDRRTDILFVFAVALKLDGQGAEFDKILGELKERASAGETAAASYVQTLSRSLTAG
jgi:hypothetical protein